MTALGRTNRYIAPMILVRAAAGCLILLLLVACASSKLPNTPKILREEFVGTTPCDIRSREFLGSLTTNSPCHSITWHLRLFEDPKTRRPATYTLVANYGLPGRNDPNQIEDGPTVKLEGRWEIDHGHKANPRAAVYRIHGTNVQKSVSLGRVGEHLFHFLNPDKSLMIGNAGWSYTLNRKGVGREN